MGILQAFLLLLSMPAISSQKKILGIQLGKNNLQKESKNYTGLSNVANNCFLNSIIQALIALPKLRREVIKVRIPEAIPLTPPAVTLYQVQRLFRAIKSGHFRTLNPLAYLASIIRASKPELVNGEQQDAAEFLEWLIEALCEGFKQIGVPEETFASLLKGEARAHILAGGTTESQGGPLPLNPIILPLKSGKWDRAMWKHFHNHISDIRRGSKTVNGITRLRVTSPPAYLVVSFARMKHKRTSRKNNKSFPFPMKIDLRDYTYTTSPAVYSLRAVILHIGSMEAGHYRTFALRGGVWWMFDDEEINAVSIEKVLTSSFGQAKNSENAYMLFYELETEKRGKSPPQIEVAMRDLVEEVEAEMVSDPARTQLATAKFTSLRNFIIETAPDSATGEMMLLDTLFSNSIVRSEQFNSLRTFSRAMRDPTFKNLIWPLQEASGLVVEAPLIGSGEAALEEFKKAITRLVITRHFSLLANQRPSLYLRMVNYEAGSVRKPNDVERRFLQQATANVVYLVVRALKLETLDREICGLALRAIDTMIQINCATIDTHAVLALACQRQGSAFSFEESIVIPMDLEEPEVQVVASRVLQIQELGIKEALDMDDGLAREVARAYTGYMRPGYQLSEKAKKMLLSGKSPQEIIDSLVFESQPRPHSSSASSTQS